VCVCVFVSVYVCLISSYARMCAVYHFL
jgi:hypothetical protein